MYDGGAHGATGSCTGVDGTDVSQGLDLGASFIDVPGGTAAWAFALPNYVSQGGLAEIVISKAPSTVTVTCPDSVAFSGAPIEPCTAEVTGAGGLSQAVPVTYVGNKLAGTATASAKYDGDANHLASEVATDTFAIIGWTRLGFYKPVDMGNDVLNVVKGGSTVPLKFTVLDQGTEVTDLAKLGATFTAREITCDMGDMPSDDLFTTTGSTSLRYDATAHQWIQNWQTPKTAGKCYKVTLTTADGLSLQAQFKIE